MPRFEPTQWSDEEIAAGQRALAEEARKREEIRQRASGPVPYAVEMRMLVTWNGEATTDAEARDAAEGAVADLFGYDTVLDGGEPVDVRVYREEE